MKSKGTAFTFSKALIDSFFLDLKYSSRISFTLLYRNAYPEDIPPRPYCLNFGSIGWPVASIATS